MFDLVLGVSETKNHGGPTLDWLERKKEQLGHLAEASELQAALKAADALHNIECTLTDLRELGLTVLDRFRGGALTVWHYSAIADLVSRKMPPGHPLASRVVDAAEQLSHDGAHAASCAAQERRTSCRRRSIEPPASG